MLTRTAEVATLLLFACWFLLSVANQFQRSERLRLPERIKSIDVVGAIPSWTFFAPRPGTSDYHLLYRQISRPGGISGWIEIPMVATRHWTHAFWNPHRRRSKVLCDCVGLISKQMHSAREEGADLEVTRSRLVVSVPYLAVLSQVMAVDADDRFAEAYRQFVVVERSGLDENRDVSVVVCSALHACSRGLLHDGAKLDD